MSYKIIFLGNHTDWWEYCLADLYKMKDIKCFNSQYLITNNYLLKWLSKITFSNKLGKIRLWLQYLWFPYFCRKISLNSNEKLVVAIYDRNKLANNTYFLNYLRKHFKQIKLVYIFTNIIKFSGASNNNFVDKLENYYDLIYAFDPTDAMKYSFKYNPLIYSKNEIKNPITKQSVFYVGKSKDRLEMLIKVYERLKELNISNKFYIFGVEKKLRKHNEEIKYNKLIPYSEVLRYIQESDCLLDIIQGESEGLTIKVCEAIYYNKLLITTNKNLKDLPFYNGKYIKIIENVNDITNSFFDNNKDINYDKSGIEYFSANTFLNKLYKDLNS